MARVPVTLKGLDTMRADLKRLKEVDRLENARDIEEARAHGDISENAEFHAAKERQAFIMGDIGKLENMLSQVEVIDPSKLSGIRVVFGATVTLLDVEKDEEVVYQIVGEYEADLAAGLISITSPIARSLIGKEPGDEVLVRAPGGNREYEILDVQFI